MSLWISTVLYSTLNGEKVMICERLLVCDLMQSNCGIP